MFRFSHESLSRKSLKSPLTKVGHANISGTISQHESEWRPQQTRSNRHRQNFNVHYSVKSSVMHASKTSRQHTSYMDAFMNIKGKDLAYTMAATVGVLAEGAQSVKVLAYMCCAPAWICLAVTSDSNEPKQAQCQGSAWTQSSLL